MEKAKIWCLFSTYNDYDQPENVLVAWWHTKPDFHTLANALGRTMTKQNDILLVVNIWNGGEHKTEQEYDYTIFRLVEIGEGTV